MHIRKIAIAFALAALVALAMPAVASANFAIHGNYVLDTDACAGCHRAHTSVSSITWQDSALNEHSALLVTSATQMWQFCYACHDATSQGADTNVQEGIYEGTLYGTPGGVLNGGGFESLDAAAVTSIHMYKGASWGAYGGGYTGQGATGADGEIPGADVGESVPIKMDCGSCHDPHGSANYRILKAQVNGNYVGGYRADLPGGTPSDPVPDGFVSSVETGWPATGFRLHTEYPDYVPNYTEPMYAKGYDMNTGVENAAKGMSGWCAGCHSTYTIPSSVYNALDGGGLKVRHRHPVNSELANFDGAMDLVIDDLKANGLPVAHDLGEEGTPVDAGGDWVECLTCHRAHGTSAVMTGYATREGAATVMDVDGVARNNLIAQSGGGGDSALLRRDNRGVCEGCHNK